MEGLTLPTSVNLDPRATLHLECLKLRSAPDGVSARLIKDSLWAEACKNGGDLFPVHGNVGHAVTTIGCYEQLDPSFTTASVTYTCQSCHWERTETRHVYLRFPSEDWPRNRPRQCPSCKHTGVTCRVTKVPHAVSVYGDTIGKAADGTIPTMIVPKFTDKPYILVFAPINVPNHFMAYVRLGQHWYKYNSCGGAETRKLLPQAFSNPPAPGEHDLVGELLYIREDIVECAIRRLEPVLGQDPVAGPPLAQFQASRPHPYRNSSRNA